MMASMLGRMSAGAAGVSSIIANLRRLLPGSRAESEEAPVEAEKAPANWPARILLGLVLLVLLSVGAGIGWLIDRWLGVSPWGLIVFVLLGFVAGVRNIMRAAAIENASGSRG